MVWKVICFICFLLITATALCGAVSAKQYTVYDGNPSNTYVTYFRDINIPFSDHYVFFRSGQYEYTMIVGDITASNGVFSSDVPCVVYTMASDGGYNSYYSYNVTSVDNFSLSVADNLIYSDIGNYPQFEERSSKYEILQTFIFVFALLCVSINRIFCFRQRGSR